MREGEGITRERVAVEVTFKRNALAPGNYKAESVACREGSKQQIPLFSKAQCNVFHAEM